MVSQQCMRIPHTLTNLIPLPPPHNLMGKKWLLVAFTCNFLRSCEFSFVCPVPVSTGLLWLQQLRGVSQGSASWKGTVSEVGTTRVRPYCLCCSSNSGKLTVLPGSKSHVGINWDNAQTGFSSVPAHAPTPQIPAILTSPSTVPVITVSSFLLCDGQLLTRPPVIPASRYSHPCILSFPHVWAGPPNLLRMNRAQQKWWHHFTFMNRLERIVAPILSTYSYCLRCTLGWSKQPCWRGPLGKGLRPLAREKLRPTTAHGELKPATTMWVGVEAYLSPVSPSDDNSPIWYLVSNPRQALSQRTQPGHCQVAGLQKLQDSKCHYFKTLGFGIICYTATGN